MVRKRARRLKRFREESERVKDADMFKIVEEVFDSITMGFIYRLESRKVLRELKGAISSGKESRVYWAKGWKGEDLAVKIYLTETSDFKKSIRKYIEGDPRFEGIFETNFRRLIYEWAKKEYRNLKRMYESGVRVPRPIAFAGNVLVMEFIGEEGYRAPLLVEVAGELEVEEFKAIYLDLKTQIETLVCKASLVHADLSEYNVMIFDGKPWIIDVSQAVDLEHPRSMEFLERDLLNVHRFFSDYINVEPLEELRGVVLKCLEVRV
ncbi:MAG: serine protein kinase RIO [Thermoprotei archaeon]|nr:serine protein kinase RIO [Thermoprotei archaeon]